MSINKIPLFLFLILLSLSACHPTKYLEKDQLLYNGATISKAKPTKDQPKANLRTELSYKIKQKPNKKIFGKRFKLWVYQQYYHLKKEKGFRHWIKTKIGEPPVFYNHRLTELSRVAMQQQLRDNGFLNATVRSDTTIKNQLVTVNYSVDGKGRFTINNYITPADTTRLLALINKPYRRPTIQPGKAYTLSAIDAERLRIERLARNNGFFEFDLSSLYFYLDTTVTVNRKLDVYLYIKPPADQKNFARYQVGNVTFYPDYSLNATTDSNEKKDTIKEGNWQLIQSKKVVKLKALKETVAQDSGSVYSQQLERQAVNYLLDLGVFKYVNLKYDKIIVDSQAVLNRNFYLTPALNQDIGVELEASSERTNFLGYTVGVNYTHRNLFRGAENFKTGLSAGAETQAGDGPFINTLEVNLNAGLSIPRLLLPFKTTSRLKESIPKTLINLNGAYTQRNTLFTSVSALAELGYSWKKKNKSTHQFYPFQFTFLRLLSTSADFKNELIINPRLKASFDDLLIFAANYRFTYSGQLLNTRKNFFYFRGELETAGNIASQLGKTNPGDPEAPKTLFKLPIAQFSRIQAETRYTWFQPKTEIVTRFGAGLAIPYGNSEAVPYIRQFFVGGASSIRAFRFRGVGPGGYSPDEGRDTTSFSFFDRVGDLKLEANIEYRFPIPVSDYLRGAIYLDVGNVWLTQKTGNDLPEGRFVWNRFYKELAVGTGLGLRLDVQYVVIRFDFGIPLRDPSLPDGKRWVAKNIQLGKRSWRKDNLTFNLAIGYPF